MELQGEDGSVVELAESVEKELGRGPGVAPHDRSVSRRQVRLQVQRVTASKVCSRFRVSIEVIGSNPICVIHSHGGEEANGKVEIVKSGTQSLLEISDKFSLSIKEPVFYTLQEPVARVGLGPLCYGGSEPRRNGSSNSGKLSEHDQNDADDKLDEGERSRGVEAGMAAADSDEEGIAEAVARWQRRKQERLQVEQKRSTQEGGATGDRIGGRMEGEREQGEDIISELELVPSQHDAPEPNDLELTGGPRTDEDDTDLVTKFGFVVEGSEFERFGKKGLDTSGWDWQIGRRPADDSDEDEDEEGGGQVSLGQTGKRSRITTGSKANQKAKRANSDDDDDWRGDSEGDNKLLSTGKRTVPRKKDVNTRSHDLATSSGTISEPRKKRKLVSTSEHGPDVKNKSPEQGKRTVDSRQAMSSLTKKSTKRKSRAKEEEEEEDDDDDDLDGFLVDDVEEDDEPEVADDEDEWTDEDEDEEVEEEDEIDEGRSKGAPPLAGNAPTTSRPVKDNKLDDKPLCKYGNKCFRKNKDHLAQFRH
ncbi:hypothetical protein M758_2G109700 [Ceratodon purpureus]|nr:hypothetical protein M758_2G109700 [Ceratodon purpureus]